jgi:hypothetical protein
MRNGAGRFLENDPWLGSPKQPRSLHRFQFAGGNPSNAYDPTGLSETNLTELSVTTLIVGVLANSSLVHASVGSVLLGGAGVPDAVGFGILGFVGVGATGTGAAAGQFGGAEIIFWPKKHVWGALTFGAGEYAFGVPSPGGPHADWAVEYYTAYYYHFDGFESGSFTLAGLAGGGLFTGLGAHEFLVGGVLNAGHSEVWEAAGTATHLSGPNAMSKEEMTNKVTGWSLIATAADAFALARTGNEGLAAGGILAAIVNGPTAALWVQAQY